MVKNLPANAGDTRDVGSIPGSGRVPGEENGNPLQYSCLGNPMDRGAWWATVHGVTKSQTWLSLCVCARTHTHTHTQVNIYTHMAVTQIWFFNKYSVTFIAFTISLIIITRLISFVVTTSFTITASASFSIPTGISNDSSYSSAMEPCFSQLVMKIFWWKPNIQEVDFKSLPKEEGQGSKPG